MGDCSPDTMTCPHAQKNQRLSRQLSIGERTETTGVPYPALEYSAKPITSILISISYTYTFITNTVNTLHDVPPSVTWGSIQLCSAVTDTTVLPSPPPVFSNATMNSESFWTQCKIAVASRCWLLQEGNSWIIIGNNPWFKGWNYWGTELNWRSLN